MLNAHLASHLHGGSIDYLWSGYFWDGTVISGERYLGLRRAIIGVRSVNAYMTGKYDKLRIILEYIELADRKC